MAEISLLVTQPVLDHVAQGGDGHRQIAMRLASADIAATIGQIRRGKARRLRLGGCVVLVAGDVGAIWRAHNEEFADDFDSLYELLARRPGREMRFLCAIED